MAGKHDVHVSNKVWSPEAVDWRMVLTEDDDIKKDCYEKLSLSRDQLQLQRPSISWKDDTRRMTSSQNSVELTVT